MKSFLSILCALVMLVASADAGAVAKAKSKSVVRTAPVQEYVVVEQCVPAAAILVQEQAEVVVASKAVARTSTARVGLLTRLAAGHRAAKAERTALRSVGVDVLTSQATVVQAEAYSGASLGAHAE